MSQWGFTVIREKRVVSAELPDCMVLAVEDDLGISLVRGEGRGYAIDQVAVNSITLPGIQVGHLCPMGIPIVLDIL